GFLNFAHPMRGDDDLFAQDALGNVEAQERAEIASGAMNRTSRIGLTQRISLHLANDSVLAAAITLRERVVGRRFGGRSRAHPKWTQDALAKQGVPRRARGAFCRQSGRAKGHNLVVKLSAEIRRGFEKRERPDPSFKILRRPI